MNVLYVASDRRGAGKTAVCATLAREATRRGAKAAVVKSTRAQDGSDPDLDEEAYRGLLGPSSVWKPQPDENADAAGWMEAVKREADRLLKGRDLLLIEGASDAQDDDGGLVDTLDAKVLVVAGYHSELEAAQLGQWHARFGDRLIGFVINGLTRYRSTDLETRLLPSISSEGLTSLGVIPEDRRLLGVTSGYLASALEGRFLVGEEFADRLVEHLMLGGLGLDSGEAYFGLRQHKAVIIRGDRPDIQMSALATPTACMVLTNDVEPIEYVVNEAELEEVPIIVTPSDTLGTMASMNEAMARPRFDHPAKLDRFAELLDRHVDLAAIYGAVGVAA